MVITIVAWHAKHHGGARLRFVQMSLIVLQIIFIQRQHNIIWNRYNAPISSYRPPENESIRLTVNGQKVLLIFLVNFFVCIHRSPQNFKGCLKKTLNGRHVQFQVLYKLHTSFITRMDVLYILVVSFKCLFGKERKRFVLVLRPPYRDRTSLGNKQTHVTPNTYRCYPTGQTQPHLSWLHGKSRGTPAS